MSITIKPIKTDTESKYALSALLNSRSNPISCQAYGGGAHCDNEARTGKKVELWGGRGDKAQDNECKLAFIVFYNKEIAAFFNIGVPGTPSTVKDKSSQSNTYGEVYESSGLFLADKYIEGNIFQEIAARVKEHVQKCSADTSFTKLIATFSTEHPYQENFWISSGAVKITGDNLLKTLGNNSLHPERFKIEEDLYECNKWDDPESQKISHEGWHDSHQCIGWTAKEMVALNVLENHIYVSDGEL